MGLTIEFDDKGNPLFMCGGQWGDDEKHSRNCSCCMRAADSLCDYPMGEGKTCDAPLCGDHACVQGRRQDRIDFCPAHHAMANGSAAPIARLPLAKYQEATRIGEDERRKAYRRWLHRTKPASYAAALDRQQNPVDLSERPKYVDEKHFADEHQAEPEYLGTIDHAVDVTMHVMEKFAAEGDQLAERMKKYVPESE